MTTQSHIATAQELFNAPDLGRCELVRGQLVMLPYSTAERGLLAPRIGVALAQFVEQRQLGIALLGDVGFQIGHEPDTVRCADVTFIRADRIPEDMSGYIDGPPDLAVEIVSPPDRAPEVLAKVQDFLAAGCQVVWVVDPGTRTVTVYESRGQAHVITEDGQLSGGDLLPGFSIALAELFAR
jgi:Uma2 family endonuclease